MDTQPLWQKQRIATYPTLTRSCEFDVVVVGGGITGVTAAYLLKKSGKRVALLERDRIGGGDTGHTSAHLSYVTDQRLTRLVKTFGNTGTRLAWQGGAAAINTIESIAKLEGIACDFRRVPAFLYAAPGDQDTASELEHEASLAVELGFSAVFQESVPIFERPGIRFSDQARFHPLSYLAGLAAAVEGDGSAVFEKSEVQEVDEEGTVITKDNHRVAAEYLVIATHVPLMGKANLASAALLQSKLAPYTTYVIGAKCSSTKFPEALFYDTADPYHYLRIDRHASHDYLIFGGKDHKTGQESDTEERFRQLGSDLHEFASDAVVTERWSGQVIETNDGLPFIGETAERQFAATGFAGTGLTFGTLAAMMACDAAMGRDNPWQDLLATNRKKIRGGAWDYFKENLDYPYYLVRDRLAGVEQATVQSLAPGEGKILKLDGERVACSRDDHGKLAQVSAICPHMGCLVRWNNAEQTWDCPCHGSRFQPTGEVIAGPAESPLEPVKAEHSAGEPSKSGATRATSQNFPR